MKIFPSRFKRARSGPDDGIGMISTTAAKDDFRHSAIRFLACIASLSVAGLALFLTNPGWWPVSVVTVAAIPLLYQLAGLRAMRAGVASGIGAFERLERRRYGVWHDVAVGDRVVSHLVVGPTGVFAISRIGWSGWFRSGQDGWLHHNRKDVGELVWEATRDAAAVKNRLRQAGLRKVPVQAVVALTRARLPKASIDLRQAVFVRMPDVSRYVLSQPASLPPEQLARAQAAFRGEEPTERSRPSRG
jgi:hypothetical protein